MFRISEFVDSGCWQVGGYIIKLRIGAIGLAAVVGVELQQLLDNYCVPDQLYRDERVTDPRVVAARVGVSAKSM